MKTNLVRIILVLLLLADLSYSFVQHLGQPLDGDMAWNIVPANDVKPVLSSPLGFDALEKNRAYPNPNRFFCHYSIKRYFETIPLFLQRFAAPVDSVYLSCAIVKIFIQVILLILLAGIITGDFNVFKIKFLVAAVLVAPFFQTNGYQSYMGIIDRTPTYTFFYALPFALLLLYFSPFILRHYHGKKPAVPFLVWLVWIPLALVICLSGPLNPGIVLIVSLLLFSGTIGKNYIQSGQLEIPTRIQQSISGIPGDYWFFLLPASLFAIYSLYLGRFNSNNINIPLAELYSRLPSGLYYPFTKKLGFPVLFLIITFNQVLIRRKFKTPEGKKLLDIFIWIGIFSLLYVLLLPLGGYRDNRPNVLRYDTFMPVTICLILLFGISTMFLFKNLSGRQKKWYIPIIAGVLLLFTLNDEPQFEKNACERIALKEIAASKNAVVRIQSDCRVLSWRKTGQPEDSRLNAQLLDLWRVTRGKTLYYNE